MNNKIILTVLTSLLFFGILSANGFAQPWFLYNNDGDFNATDVDDYYGYSYRREAGNYSNLVTPYIDEDPDGDASLSDYYLCNNSVFSTFVDGSKNQQSVGDFSDCSGLVSYWTLDNDNAWDPIGGNNGTINTGGNTITGATGQVNGAYDFDGSDDWVETNANWDLTSVTVSAWVNIDQQKEQRIIDSSEDEGWSRIRVQINSDGTISNGIAGGVTSTSSITTGQWYHIVAVHDAVNEESKIYIDGQLDNTGGSNSWNINTGSNQWIGASYDNNVDGAALDGRIDDVRIYDRALSSSEVQALYDATKPTAGNDPTFGAEEMATTNQAPDITIYDPKSKTYNVSSIPVNVSTSDPDGDQYDCNISDDGTIIGTTDETSQTYTDTLNKNDGNHDLSVSCEDNNTATSSSSVSYTVDTKVKTLNLIDPAEGSEHERDNIPLNYIASDNLSSIDQCWYSLDGGANNTIAGCSNTSVSTGTIGGHNITLYANDTVGNEDSETNTFDTYHENEI